MKRGTYTALMIFAAMACLLGSFAIVALLGGWNEAPADLRRATIIINALVILMAAVNVAVAHLRR